MNLSVKVVHSIPRVGKNDRMKKRKKTGKRERREGEKTAGTDKIPTPSTCKRTTQKDK